MLAPWNKSCDEPRQCIIKQRHYFVDRGPSNQSYGFSSSHVWMRELDHKEGWVPKNWSFETMVLEKTFENPWDNKEIKPVHPKGDQSWLFNGRTDAEAETPILWPPDEKMMTHLKRPWCWERLRAGREADGREWVGWMASPTQWTWVWANSYRMVKDGEAWCAAVRGVVKSRTWLSYWTTASWSFRKCGNALSPLFYLLDSSFWEDLFGKPWRNVFNETVFGNSHESNISKRWWRQTCAVFCQWVFLLSPWEDEIRSFLPLLGDWASCVFNLC